MNNTTVILLALIFILLSPSINLSYDAGRGISLSEAVRIAVEMNHDLKVIGLENQNSRFNQRIAASAFSPKLDIEQTNLSTDQPVNVFGIQLNQAKISQTDFNPDLLNDPEAIEDSVTSIIIHQPIFNSGKEIIGYQISSRQLEQSNFNTASQTEAILVSIITSYLDSVRSREQKKVADESLRISERNLESIENRYSQGLAVKSDVMQAQVQRSQIRESTIILDNQYRLTCSQLNSLLGDSSSNYIPSGDLTGSACPEIDLNSLQDIALRDRPEIQSLRMDEQIAALQIKQSRWNFLPSINARGSYDYHGGNLLSSGDSSYNVALQLKLNLFNGSADYYQIKKSKNSFESIRYARRSLENRIKIEVEKAYYDMIAAQQRISTQTETVELANETLRIITQRYLEGAQLVTDLLSAELALTAARLHLLNAQYDLVLGHSYLAKSVGHLKSRWLEPDKCPIPMNN